MTDHAQPRPPELSKLLRERRAELRLTLRDVAERTLDDTGVPIVKRTWLSELEAAEPGPPPGEERLRALARALELPYVEVCDAAAVQFWGIRRVWHKGARALVTQAERMTPEQLEYLHRMIETFLPPPEERHPPSGDF